MRHSTTQQNGIQKRFCITPHTHTLTKIWLILCLDWICMLSALGCFKPNYFRSWHSLASDYALPNVLGYWVKRFNRCNCMCFGFRFLAFQECRSIELRPKWHFNQWFWMKRDNGQISVGCTKNSRHFSYIVKIRVKLKCFLFNLILFRALKLIPKNGFFSIIIWFW